MLLATVLGLPSLEVMGVPLEDVPLDCPLQPLPGIPSLRTMHKMSSDLCVVLREGIPGQVREQSAYGHSSPPPHRAALGLSLQGLLLSLDMNIITGTVHLSFLWLVFTPHLSPHTWLLIKIPTVAETGLA